MQSRIVANKQGVTRYDQCYEDGESVAEVGSFDGLVITGTTRKYVIKENQVSRLGWSNILLFSIDPQCKLKVARHYDIDRKVSK